MSQSHKVEDFYESTKNKGEIFSKASVIDRPVFTDKKGFVYSLRGIFQTRAKDLDLLEFIFTPGLNVGLKIFK